MLAVVGFHAFPMVVPGGFVGVDIFFVISGYLISTIILTAVNAGRFSFATFYARRIRRIFPAPASSCWPRVTRLGVVPAVRRRASNSSASTSPAAPASLSISCCGSEAGYFDAAADAKPLLHLWSLGIEEQFYIVWPLLVLAGLEAAVRPASP